MTPDRRSFLKKISLGSAGLGLISFLPGGQACLAASSTDKLPRSTPEEEGVPTAAIDAFLDAIGRSKHELHSFMIARNGRVVAEAWWAPYSAGLNHTMYSLSKSFTSTAIGFAVAERKLGLEDHVVSFFTGEQPAAQGENLAAMRVKDLLMMAAGHATEPTWEMIKEQNWVKAFLAWPVPHPPGATFLYNSACTYMLSAIIQKVTGQPLIDFLTARLFKPLGIADATWETCPRGINTGGWGLNIQTEGLLKFGQLYLQKGFWNGRPLLPRQWVEDATSTQIQPPLPSQPARPNQQNDWVQGYGYQFWRSTHGAYRGDGAFGQFAIVIPNQNAVISITSETSDMQGLLDLVWQHLLPALHNTALPAAQGDHRVLWRRLSSLALSPPRGTPTSPASTRISDRNFNLAANSLGLESASFTFANNGCLFVLRSAGEAYPISCGIEKWRLGDTALPGTPPNLVPLPRKPGKKSKIAASGTWKDEQTFELMLRYYETPHHDSITCRFDKDNVQIAFMNSMAAMNEKPKDPRPVLQGHMTPARVTTVKPRKPKDK